MRLNCDRFSAIYQQRGMHLFAALPRMLSSLLDMATSRISRSGSPPPLPRDASCTPELEGGE